MSSRFWRRYSCRLLFFPGYGCFGDEVYLIECGRRFAAFSTALWMLATYFVLTILNGAKAQPWLMVGALIGVGLQNYWLIVLLGFGLAVGLLLTPHRRQLASPYLWAWPTIALIVFLPNLVWQDLSEPTPRLKGLSR